jgi:hypothetical protein
MPDTNKTKQILIRVTPDTKEKWKEEIVNAQDCPQNTMTAAVENAMKRTYFTDTTRDNTGNVDVDLDPVTDALADIDDRLGEMSDQIDRLDVRSKDMDTMDLVTRLKDLIPMHDTADRFVPLARAASYDSPRRRAEQMSTPGAYADYFDIDEDAVQDALDLIEEAGQAEYVTDNGRRRYWVPMNTMTEES